jgi:hypothetical protein
LPVLRYGAGLAKKIIIYERLACDDSTCLEALFATPW